jgi:hypothetical protein
VLRGRDEDGNGVDLGQSLSLVRGRADSTGELRRLAWSGVPEEVRPIVWQLLLVSRRNDGSG